MAATELQLDPAEAEVLAASAADFAAALSDPATRTRYEVVASTASNGAVSADLIPAVEMMIELVLQKGAPSNRAVLQSIYGRTPRGQHQASAARDVNRALQTLRGQTLEDIRISAGPSAHTVVLQTDRCRLTLEVDRFGARVTSLETG